jgi:hypothetical protein
MQKETFDLANAVIDWHADKINHLRGMLAAVEASTDGVMMQGPEGEPVKLTQEEANAFVLGVNIAIVELEELPFSLSRVNDPDGTKPH